MRRPENAASSSDRRSTRDRLLCRRQLGSQQRQHFRRAFDDCQQLLLYVDGRERDRGVAIAVRSSSALTRRDPWPCAGFGVAGLGLQRRCQESAVNHVLVSAQSDRGSGKIAHSRGPMYRAAVRTVQGCWTVGRTRLRARATVTRPVRSGDSHLVFASVNAFLVTAVSVSVLVPASPPVGDASERPFRMGSRTSPRCVRAGGRLTRVFARSR